MLTESQSIVYGMVGLSNGEMTDDCLSSFNLNQTKNTNQNQHKTCLNSYDDSYHKKHSPQIILSVLILIYKRFWQQTGGNMKYCGKGKV